MAKRTAATSISEVIINGYLRYRLTYPTAEGRKREHFTKKSDAEKKLKEIQADQKQYGLSASAMTSTTRADALAAEKILKGTGLTLVEVARAMATQKREAEAGVPIAEAVQSFIESREGNSKDYLITLKGRMAYIGNFWVGRSTATISPTDCQKLLDSLTPTHSPRTVHHYRTHLSVLFAFCENRGWIKANPAKRTMPVKVVSEEVKILTPQDAATLLSVCHRDILPGVVIAMFCGLRQAEVERIDWRAVDLAQGHITIGASVAKTNSRRVCVIPDNGQAWLAPYARESGNVWPKNQTLARNLWTLARINAGYGPFFTNYTPAKKTQIDPVTEKERTDLRPWPDNALRHSAITYRVAAERDLARIAYESGNSPKVIQTHYNGLAKPQAANLFFSIMPEAPANVAQFKTA